MKDLPMFNKLFFVLCSSLLIALTSPSAAEEPTYHTIQGSEGEYAYFGTNQEARAAKTLLSTQWYVKAMRRQITYVKREKANYNKTQTIRTKNWNSKTSNYQINAHKHYDAIIARHLSTIKGEEKKIMAPLGAKRERQYKLKKAKENEAAAQKKREEEEARIKEAIRKQQLEKKISSVLKIIAGINGPKDPNKITSITKDGQVRTLYCSSACTPGSVKLHEIITGIPMGVDVGTLTKRIEANAAQGKRQDNTNENNAKAAEDIASQGNVSIDTLFEQAEADIATHDTSFARAQSIPLGQRIRNREAHTEYVRSQSENEAYCLYEGC